MAIVYALVARGTVVLAEFAAVSGNAGAVARRVLEKLPPDAESRLCFAQDRYIFHVLRDQAGITFLCMANDTFGSRDMQPFQFNLLYVWRIPFLYLEDIQMRFMKNYGRVAHSALAYAMNDEFSRVLHHQMEFFSSNPSADTLNRLRGEVSEASTFKLKTYLTYSMYLVYTNHLCPLRLLQIHTVMVDNIEKILDRGDRISLLVDKTSTMQDSAFHFRKQSKRLRRALWMKNAKLLMMDDARHVEHLSSQSQNG
ncbi:hypothetical protein C2845_PM13G00170 [Panicum miliaceum]|uniref:Vesicle-associated membrane protein 714 n=1 Tax=Panicum miliaceum TaxID=4540 RepID=A0A3L6RLM0_PANMI|nr:hypothetical protein C2845_PM13G00170 [Panicum miliaceum]